MLIECVGCQFGLTDLACTRTGFFALVANVATGGHGLVGAVLRRWSQRGLVAQAATDLYPVPGDFALVADVPFRRHFVARLALGLGVPLRAVLGRVRARGCGAWDGSGGQWERCMHVLQPVNGRRSWHARARPSCSAPPVLGRCRTRRCGRACA